MKTVLLHGTKAAGRVALVDDDDYELVSQYRWFTQEKQSPRRNNGPYAVAHARHANGRRVMIRMHCLIMGCTRIDHADGDGLNNQRENLRAATTAQNAQNQMPRRGCASMYKGVSWHRQSQKWRASIQTDGQSRFLGYFSDEREAAQAYDAAARETFGEFARTNFTLEAAT